MQLNLFWKNRPQNEKNTYLIGIGFFFLLLVFMFFNHLIGIFGYLDWNILAQADTTNIIVKSYEIGPFSLNQPVENTYFLQKFAGTAPLINQWQYLLFALFIGLSVAVLLAIITTFSRFWYFIGIGLFTLFLVSLKLELLLFFGSNEKFGLIIAFLIYIPTSYYFNSFRNDISLLKRMGVFVFTSFLFAIIIHFTATTPSPLLYLATSLTTGATVLSLIFIFTVAHEIIAGFAFLLFGTGTTNTKNGTFHFLIISSIYLINLTLAYLHEGKMIDWDIYYIDVFLLLGISSILGIWGFKHRENQYSFVVSFFPAGGIAFLVFGMICFATISFFYQIGNDAGLEIFRDFIIFSHIGYGLIFVLYFLANFAILLKSNMAIYKVLYTPKSMPFFTFRFAGTIIIIAFVLKANWQVPIFQNTASNHIATGDYHYLMGNKLLAKRYYSEASKYAKFNHRSNYSLAVLDERDGHEERAIFRYKEAIKKYPSPQAYVNLAALYSKQDKFFEALFAASEGYTKFPENAQLANTLGLLYGKTDVLDSAIYFLDIASQNTKDGGAASNIIALLAKNKIGISLDSVLKEYQYGANPMGLNNGIVLSNTQGQVLDYSYDFGDSILSPLSGAILSNNAINELFGNDTIELSEINALANHPGNLNIREKLNYIYGLHLYHNHRVNEAFRKLNWMANTSQLISAKYYNDIGLWALDQNAPKVAAQYFQWAIDNNYQEAPFNLAVALAESKDYTAGKLWQDIATSGAPELRKIAQKMTSVFSDISAENSEDLDKYLSIRYTLTAEDTLNFNRILSTIEDDNYKAAAILEMSQTLWDNNWNDHAIITYKKTENLKVTDQKLYEALLFFELNALAYRGEIRNLAKRINEGKITFDADRILEKTLYTGLIADANGDSLQAKKSFEYLAYKNPFYEESIIISAKYFNTIDKFKAYNILLTAKEINPYSIKILIAYIYQCARIQQSNYGRAALEELKRIINAKDYEKVEGRFLNLEKDIYQALYLQP